MRESYRAILRGNRLEWQGRGPTTNDQGVAVRVTVVEDAQQTQHRGARMAAALEQLAATNPFREVDDPASWERHQREERQLPGRD